MQNKSFTKRVIDISSYWRRQYYKTYLEDL